MVTGTEPAAIGGVRQVMVVSLTTVRSVQGVRPKSTVSPSSKVRPMPVTVTSVPPETAPRLGSTKKAS